MEVYAVLALRCDRIFSGGNPETGCAIGQGRSTVAYRHCIAGSGGPSFDMDSCTYSP